MTWIYLLATVFGGIFVIPMLLGGLDIDADVDIDLDADLDLDLDMDMDLDMDVDMDADASAGSALDTDLDLDTGMDGDGFMDSFGNFAGSLLSFRSIVLFITFFGVTGLVFTLLGFRSIPTALTAVALGSVAASLNSLLFTFIRGHEVNSQLTDRDIEGSMAKVILPIENNRKGRIRAELNQQPHYLVALPSELDRNHSFAVGDPVVVVSMEQGTARVARLDLDALNESTNEGKLS